MASFAQLCLLSGKGAQAVTLEDGTANGAEGDDAEENGAEE